jgi:ribosomal protein L20
MIDRRLLEIMYQQWIQGLDDYSHQWINFVEMAAREQSTTADKIMEELQKCQWFIIKGD